MIGPAILALALAAPGEAEVVRGVRVEAAPAEARRLEPLVTVPTGVALDAEAVRRSVERIFATGEVLDVRVEAEPATPDGVVLVFRPVPAAVLAEIAVDGDRLLDADEARQVTRLLPREALWPARLERAARDLAVRLAEEGYLEARVTPELRARPDGAAAVFHVAGGSRVRARRVRVSADPGVEGWLVPLVEPDPGEPFRRGQARRAAEKMRALLAARRRWRAEVTPEESYDPAAAAVDLTFRAAAGPFFEVALEGDRVPAAVVRKVEDALRDGRARGDALEEGREILEAHLRASGHREPRVTHREEARPGRARVVYVVERGPRATVASVTFHPGPAPPVALATRAGEPLQDALLEADAERVRRALEERGHVEPRVEIRAPAGGGPIPVTVQVDAGPVMRVEKVQVVVPFPPPPEVRAVELRLRAGAPYRVRDLALDRQALLVAWRNAGYPEVSVSPRVEFSADRARATAVLEVAPGPRARVDRIVVSGLSRTREEVVRRELLFREGEPLGLEQVAETQRRLAGLGLFESVSVVELEPDAEGHRSVAVRLREAPATTVGYGIGYGERDLLRASVEVTRRNLLGMDRRVSAFARMSFRGTRLLATYREPYLLGQRQELFVTAFREEEDREAFDFTRHGLTVQTIRDLGPSWRVVARAGYQQIRTYNAEEDCLLLDRQFCPATLSGPSASLVHDTRDDPIDPRRGRFVITDAVLSHGALGGDSLVKGFVQASTYRLVQPRVLVALSARAGAGRTFGDAPLLLPAPERFVAGGDYSVRGFGVDDVRPEGGNGLLLGSAEVRVDVGRGLWVAAFTDVGNVYRLASDITLSDLRTTAGAGLRYRSPLGPLRFDWGYKLDRREGESPYHLHFTVGHAF